MRKTGGRGFVMRKAIDNYAIGKQKEVTAWKGQSISASNHRFFCPECMEYVSLDVRGHFRHKKRTSQSLACEKRVDSPSRSSYERMGLPLYIRKEMDDRFLLYIGFPAIPQNALDEAIQSKATLELSDGENSKKKYIISPERFDSEHIARIALDFLPINRGKFKIEYTNTPRTIVERWTNSSDMWGDGQFFKIGEEYCRKIRPLGTIVSDQEYYFLGNPKLFQQFKSYVEISEEGFLNIRHDTPVHKICIHGNKATESIFNSLSSLLMEKYHLSFLIGESELSPLWPPCIMDDNYFLFPSQTQKALFVTNSPNEAPVIYRYQGSTYQDIPLGTIQPSLFELKLTNIEIPLSVDKVFNGNIQFVRKQDLSLLCSNLEIDILEKNGESIIDNVPKKLTDKEFQVKCNYPCTIYHFRTDGSDISYKINSTHGTYIKNINWDDKLIIISNTGRQLLSYVFKKDNQIQLPIDADLVDIIRRLRGPTVPINTHTIALCRKSTLNPLIRQEILKYIRIGKIPVQVVNILNNRFGGR